MILRHCFKGVVVLMMICSFHLAPVGWNTDQTNVDEAVHVADRHIPDRSPPKMEDVVPGGKRHTSDQTPPIFHLVFSSGCSTNQNLQAEVLLYSIRKVGFTGPVTRLLSDCERTIVGKYAYFNDRGDKSSVEEVRGIMETDENTFLHVTPTFESARDYTFINKAAGVDHWLKNTNVGNAYIVLIDPDFIMLNKNFELPYEYSAATFFYSANTWFEQFQSQKINLLPGYQGPNWTHHQASKFFVAGPPYIVTAEKLSKLTPLWMDYAMQYHALPPQDFMSEMYGYSLAAMHINIPHKIEDNYIYKGGHTSGLSGLKGKYTCGDLSTIDGLPMFMHVFFHPGHGDYRFFKGHIPPEMMDCEMPLFLTPKESIPQAEMSDTQFGDFFYLCHVIGNYNAFLQKYKAKHCSSKMYLAHEYIKTYTVDQNCGFGVGYRHGCWRYARLVDQTGQIIPKSDIGKPKEQPQIAQKEPVLQPAESFDVSHVDDYRKLINTVAGPYEVGPALPTDDHVLGFPFDHGGWNNIYMMILNAFVAGFIFDRTIVLPPQTGLYLISNRIDVWTQLFDIASLRSKFKIRTSQEYFNREITYDEYTKYFQQNDELSNFVRDRPKKDGTISLFLSDNRFKENRPLPAEIREGKVWYFTHGHGGDRKISVFDAIFRGYPELDRVRLAVYQGFRFNREIIEMAVSAYKEMKLPRAYNAIHIRRGDFQYKHPEPAQIVKDLQANNFDTKLPLLIVTKHTLNSKDPGLDMTPLTEAGYAIRYISYPESVHSEDQGHVDVFLALGAHMFMGTKLSTYTAAIDWLRGYASLQFPEIESAVQRFDEASDPHVDRIDGMNGEWKCKEYCWTPVVPDRWLGICEGVLKDQGKAAQCDRIKSTFKNNREKYDERRKVDIEARRNEILR